MAFLVFSISCSVLVSILLKIAPQKGLDSRQLIGFGYLVAAALAWIFLSPNPSALIQNNEPAVWLVFFSLSLLLPSIFFIFAKAISSSGIVLSDAAQRLSLLLPLLAAFLFFNEVFSWQKGLGLALGLSAICCLIYKPKKENFTNKNWLWLGLVFIGLGIIDILFKQMASLSHIHFVNMLFAVFSCAFILSCCYLAVLFARKKAQFSLHNMIGAFILGALNFGNILFYIKAHQHFSKSPALVFASMNIGVIVLGSLVGLLIFKEHLSRLNQIGLALAVVAVAVLAKAG